MAVALRLADTSAERAGAYFRRHPTDPEPRYLWIVLVPQGDVQQLSGDKTTALCAYREAPDAVRIAERGGQAKAAMRDRPTVEARITDLEKRQRP